jgi:uncharacterized protein
MTFIDRRLNDKKKSLVNRKKFLDRSKVSIKESLKKALSSRKITDLDSKEKISINPKGINEPYLSHDTDGNRDFILPGNKTFDVGDELGKPTKEDGGDGKEGSEEGEGVDDFTFTLDKDEFFEILFDGLELPNLTKKNAKEIETYKIARAGFTTTGPLNNLSLIKTMKSSLGRKVALEADYDRKIKEEEEKNNPDPILLEDLFSKKGKIPFLDDFDLKFKSYTKVAEPTTSAVMICLMDVSASMGEFEKDLAKRFFILLYRFLKIKYKKVDTVFIRHHTVAEEVDEEEFFYGVDTGGTVVSSGLEKAVEIIKKDYSSSNWNIYMSQLSDGDNFINDNVKSVEILKEQLLPAVQFYTYIEIKDILLDPNFRYQSSKLQDHYKTLVDQFTNLVIKEIQNPSDIYIIFRELFGVKNATMVG